MTDTRAEQPILVHAGALVKKPRRCERIHLSQPRDARAVQCLVSATFFTSPWCKHGDFDYAPLSPRFASEQGMEACSRRLSSAGSQRGTCSASSGEIYTVQISPYLWHLLRIAARHVQPVLLTFREWAVQEPVFPALTRSSTASALRAFPVHCIVFILAFRRRSHTEGGNLQQQPSRFESILFSRCPLNNGLKRVRHPRGREFAEPGSACHDFDSIRLALCTAGCETEGTRGGGCCLTFEGRAMFGGLGRGGGRCLRQRRGKP